MSEPRELRRSLIKEVFMRELRLTDRGYARLTDRAIAKEVRRQMGSPYASCSHPTVAAELRRLEENGEIHDLDAMERFEFFY